jgi:hypothetical protein
MGNITSDCDTGSTRSGRFFIPALTASDHYIEHDDRLADAGGQGDLPVFAFREQALV